MAEVRKFHEKIAEQFFEDCFHSSTVEFSLYLNKDDKIRVSHTRYNDLFIYEVKTNLDK